METMRGNMSKEYKVLKRLCVTKDRIQPYTANMEKKEGRMGYKREYKEFQFIYWDRFQFKTALKHSVAKNKLIYCISQAKSR